MSFQKLSPDARRIRTIIVALPVICITSYILYKRLALGEQQRRIPQHGPLLSVKTTMPPRERGTGTENAAASGPSQRARSGDGPEREKTP